MNYAFKRRMIQKVVGEREEFPQRISVEIHESPLCE